MKYSFILVLALIFYSCGTSGDTARAQYSNSSQEGFRNSPLDSNGGIRNESSFRRDRNRYHRPQYQYTHAKEYNYALRKGQKKDTTSTKTIKISDKKNK